MLSAAQRVGLAWLASASAAWAKELLKGICYQPVPVADTKAPLPPGDWYSEDTRPLWSAAGRGDLGIMASLGANLVRLYVNNPEGPHGAFLDEAHGLGLRVAPGMGDSPYLAGAGACLGTDFNCFAQVKAQYAMNLRGGFLTPNRTYHPALLAVHLVDEPDVKLPPNGVSVAEGPARTARAVVSAFDALLEAEKEAGVTGPLINVTATFSFAMCSACARFQDAPALGQMAQLEDAMQHPEKYGYTPRNNVTEAYRARWTHSFNSGSNAAELQGLLEAYAAEFTTTPLYLGEFHSVAAENVSQDVGLALTMAAESGVFLGVSFFEFQVSYYRGGATEKYGLFAFDGDATSYRAARLHSQLEVHCLAPTSQSGGYMAAALADAYGGRLNASALCDLGPRTTTATATTTTTETNTTTATTATTSTAPAPAPASASAAPAARAPTTAKPPVPTAAARKSSSAQGRPRGLAPLHGGALLAAAAWQAALRA